MTIQLEAGKRYPRRDGSTTEPLVKAGLWLMDTGTDMFFGTEGTPEDLMVLPSNGPTKWDIVGPAIEDDSDA